MSNILSDLKNETSQSIKYLSENNIDRTLSSQGIRIRKLLASVLRKVYRTQTDYKIVIEKRERLEKSKKGRIFALNHRQADDIVIGANAVNQSACVVFRILCLAFETLNGLGILVYGMILLMRDDIPSRKIAYRV